MKILVTGAAGFIGFHLSMRLCAAGHEVVGLDNVNDYYDVTLKTDRLKLLSSCPNFLFYKLDLVDWAGLNSLFSNHKFDLVFHLAAQAGVRYSIDNPQAYVQSNLVGFGNILELSRQTALSHLVYASSSSVYGLNSKLPFSTTDPVDHPVSFYAATKRSNELMAHSYSHLYGLPTTGLRFFTVYGPWGRPDMAVYLFTKALYEEKEISLFNHGRSLRDFTYIDDIVDGLVALLDKAPQKADSAPTLSPDNSSAPYRILNIGNNSPEKVTYLIECLEKHTGKSAKIKLSPPQAGDVDATYADIDSFSSLTGFSPKTPLVEGTAFFVEWYKSYYLTAV